LVDLTKENQEREARRSAWDRLLFLGPRMKSWQVCKRLLLRACRGPVGRILLPGLGRLSHYPPKKFIVPDLYRETKVPSLTPRISIVTPSLNQGAFLEITLRSVLDQAYPALEYIVQDGGSVDCSVEILCRHEKNLTHWESTPDRGQAHAINCGFRHATGDIMAWVNSDDLLLPGALNYVADFFNKHPEVDVVYGHRILIDEDGSEIGRWILPEHDEEVLHWADYIPQETLFWRRRVWTSIDGALDESFKFAMDWDLILRFQKAQAKFVRVPRFLGAFRVSSHQKTVAAMDCHGLPEMALLRERCHGRPIPPEEVDMRVRKYLLKHVLCQLLYNLRLVQY
jgi:glycosyltransferase involved in cell wall biosynthesis